MEAKTEVTIDLGKTQTLEHVLYYMTQNFVEAMGVTSAALLRLGATAGLTKDEIATHVFEAIKSMEFQCPDPQKPTEQPDATKPN